jgi:hypothetical protein
MSYNLFGHATAEKSPGVENELERELKEELDKLV